MKKLSRNLFEGAFVFTRLISAGALLCFIASICLVLTNGHIPVTHLLLLSTSTFIASFAGMMTGVYAFMASALVLGSVAIFARSKQARRGVFFAAIALLACQVVAQSLYTHSFARGLGGICAILLPSGLVLLAFIAETKSYKLLRFGIAAGLCAGLFCALLALANNTDLPNLALLTTWGDRIQAFGTLIVLFAFGLTLPAIAARSWRWRIAVLGLVFGALLFLWLGAPISFLTPFFVPETQLVMSPARKVDNRLLLLFLGILSFTLSLKDWLRRAENLK